MFVIHVSMKNGQLKFDPPVQDISEAWGQFCDLLSVAAYRALQSSSIVFDMIKNQINGQTHTDHIPSIKVTVKITKKRI